MGLFSSLFGGAPDFESAVKNAESALRPQVNKLLILDSGSEKGMEKLNSAGTLCLLHGFISFYSQKYKLKNPEEKLAATLRVFSNLFGEQAGGKMIQTLQSVMRVQQNWMYLSEGENAAKYYEKDGMHLVAAFLGEA